MDRCPSTDPTARMSMHKDRDEQLDEPELHEGLMVFRVEPARRLRQPEEALHCPHEVAVRSLHGPPDGCALVGPHTWRLEEDAPLR
eukprot:15492323-Heterocapsa_arctica.AAC.1